MAGKAGILKENMKYFGYGYIKDADDVVPSIPLCFYTFRIMVGLGCLFILFFALTLFFVYKRDITKGKWWKWLGIILLPLGYLASESGWLVAEFGHHHLLPLPYPLYGFARCGNQYFVQANQKGTRIFKIIFKHRSL